MPVKVKAPELMFSNVGNRAHFGYVAWVGPAASPRHFLVQKMDKTRRWRTELLPDRKIIGDECLNRAEAEAAAQRY